MGNCKSHSATSCAACESNTAAKYALQPGFSPASPIDGLEGIPMTGYVHTSHFKPFLGSGGGATAELRIFVQPLPTVLNTALSGSTPALCNVIFRFPHSGSRSRSSSSRKKSSSSRRSGKHFHDVHIDIPSSGASVRIPIAVNSETLESLLEDLELTVVVSGTPPVATGTAEETVSLSNLLSLQPPRIDSTIMSGPCPLRLSFVYIHFEGMVRLLLGTPWNNLLSSPSNTDNASQMVSPQPQSSAGGFRANHPPPLNDLRLQKSEDLGVSPQIAPPASPRGAMAEANSAEMAQQLVSSMRKAFLNGADVYAKDLAAVAAGRAIHLDSKDFGYDSARYDTVRPIVPGGLTATIKEFNPRVFNALRAMHGIVPAEFAAAWDLPASKISLTTGAGRSGSLFLQSKDRKYMLKTVPHDELRTLFGLLPDYWKYLSGEGKDSFLMRVLGIFRIIAGKMRIYAIVFDNVLALKKKPSQLFDLKGRVPKPGKAFQNRSRINNDPSYVLKDKDLEREFYLPSQEAVTTLLSRLERDVKWLVAHNMMDYSVLVGVINLDSPDALWDNCSPPARTPQGKHPSPTDLCRLPWRKPIPGHHMSKEVFQVGIIDCLTNYSMKKVVANRCKRFLWDQATLSTVQSSMYADRLMKFMCNVFVVPSHGVPLARLSIPLPVEEPSEASGSQLPLRLPSKTTISAMLASDRGLSQLSVYSSSSTDELDVEAEVPEQMQIDPGSAASIGGNNGLTDLHTASVEGKVSPLPVQMSALPIEEGSEISSSDDELFQAALQARRLSSQPPPDSSKSPVLTKSPAQSPTRQVIPNLSSVMLDQDQDQDQVKPVQATLVQVFRPADSNVAHHMSGDDSDVSSL